MIYALAMTKDATVGFYMTASPQTVGQQQAVSVARKLMREHRIHHLPVLHSGGLVGMVTLRDLDLIGSLDSVDDAELTVEEAMTTDLYLVHESTPLAEVVRTMVDRKISSAVIVDPNNHVKGVFTNVDGLRALRDLLA